MSNFLDCSYDLLRNRTPGIDEFRSEFELVFNSISELQGVHAKSYLNLDNIEIVFGAIEMALLLRKLGERSIEEIEEIRRSLITLIYKTLEFSIKFPVRGQYIDPPPPYMDFTRILEEVRKDNPSRDPHKFSFITFNYDLCLDHALHASGKRINYCLDGNNKTSTLLLKLHGSINWGTDEEGIIHPHEVSEANFQLWGDTKFVYFNLGSTLDQKQINGKALVGPPVIVPPTWNKNSYHGQLSNVWSAAAEEFSQAENIFVIGYSLPETDSFFRYLYALGSESKTRLRNFIVINPDSSGITETRFRELVGRGIENRFKYIPKDFIQSIPNIKNILMNP